MKFLADENFNNRIIRGLLRRMPTLDIVCVQDVEIAGSDDQTVLAWAAREGRILLTHDQRTIPYHALTRLENGELLAGAIIVAERVTIRSAIDDLLIIATCSVTEEWANRIEFLPL